MNSIRCIIVDDEPLAQDVISGYIAKLEFLTEVGKFDDALSAMEYLKDDQVDIIFLDIQMPMLNGINFLKTLSYTPHVIFTTAHRNYAVEGFELNAIDYLIKPIPFYRFVQAVEKVKKQYTVTESSTVDLPEAAFFKVDNKKVKVKYTDILFIESLKDYIKVVLTNRSFVTYQTLSGILEILPSNQFVQIHKSYIINFHYVNAIEGNTLEIEHHKIPVGRSYREKALQKIYNTGDKGWRS
ncbi:LytR/AlgR family response regulator transcription factor [Aquimarina spongiae]|uniref:Two component transcriptional regulator, LytTR family n=1 Tax=Aquimarina spongiae TaxID=570521 RepID=A0A1M6BBJ8_9FLAO|nr:LytTR family DNA-binding domain-containing protein [Aquimarina spongiae]SHI46120.1 two component transcriptional regulator, LytTR family [Aquimarina spongiae]